MKKVKTIIMTSIIAPYRVPLFNRLAKEDWLDLEVFFCRTITKDRQWDIPKDMQFKYKILKGTTFSLRARTYYNTRTVYFNLNLLPELIRSKPDIVISQEYSIPSALAYFYCKLFEKRYISWSEGTPLSDTNIDLIQKFLRRIIVSASKSYIACSTDAREQYILLGAKPEKVFIGIQTTDVKTFERKVEKIREKGVFATKKNINEKFILYTGSLIERKGIIHLLDAVKILSHKLKNFHVILVGDGDQKRILQDFCVKNNLVDMVSFVGFKQQYELPYYYAQADIYIFPTLLDTFGVVINEAMAAGLPVICSKYAGAANDLIMEGINGYVIEPRDHRKMADYLFKILTNDKLRVKMGEASKGIIENYDIAAATTGFIKACRKSLET